MIYFLFALIALTFLAVGCIKSIPQQHTHTHTHILVVPQGQRSHETPVERVLYAEIEAEKAFFALYAASSASPEPRSPEEYKLLCELLGEYDTERNIDDLDAHPF